MNLDLSDAILCASMILDHAGVSLHVPKQLPAFEQRQLTFVDHERKDVPPDAVALFFPKPPNGLVIAPEWNLLVHESVHFLEFENGLPLNEDWAYFAQARAYQCTFSWETNCPAGMRECRVGTYTPQ